MRSENSGAGAANTDLSRTNEPLWMGLGPDGPVHITFQNAWGFELASGSTRWHREVDINAGAHARSAPVMALALLDRVVVVDTRSWARLATLEEPLPEATKMALSDDGATLAFARRTGVTLLDVATGKTRPLDGPSDVRSLAFRADGKWLAAGSENADFEAWSVEKGDDVTSFVLDLRRRFNRHELPVYDVALSDDGRLLATGDAGSVVKVWDLAAAQPAGSERGRAGYRALRPSPSNCSTIIAPTWCW